MSSRRRTGLRILVFLAFVAVTLGIGFFHTETGPLGGKNCPACQFLTASLSTSPGIALIVPALLLQGTITPVEHSCSSEGVVLSLCSRSPPSA